MFNSVVIATDIDAGPDRAIPVGTALAHRGRLLVEVLTVVSEPGGPVDDARRRHAMADGVGDALCVVHGDDIAAAIVDQVRDREGALLVMTTSWAGGPSHWYSTTQTARAAITATSARRPRRPSGLLNRARSLVSAPAR